MSKGPGKRRHIVADTLLPMMFLGLCKLGNICCGHKMFLNKIRNIFVSRTQNLCPQQMLRAWANGETFVSATMCLQQCVLVCHGLYTRLFSSNSVGHFSVLKYFWLLNHSHNPIISEGSDKDINGFRTSLSYLGNFP